MRTTGWQHRALLVVSLLCVTTIFLTSGCDPCPKCVKPTIKPTPTPTATPTPSMALVAGGGNASAEIYASATRTFSCVGGLAPGGGCASVMSASRVNQTATLLNSGAVLIAGGFDVTNGSFLSSADLFVSPSAGFTPVTAAMTMARAFDAATLLSAGGGEVLIAGGFDTLTTELATAELYNPATESFARTGVMSEPRADFTLTTLPDGTALAAGGAMGVTGALDTAEIYNPATGTFTCVGGVNPATGLCNQSMSDARAHFTATPLKDGTVLLAGGLDNTGKGVNTAEIYNPATGTFTCVGGVSATPPLCNPSMVDARIDHSATLLNDGTVLIAGGLSNDVATASAEIYNPATKTFTATGSMNVARSTHTGTLLKDGTVLIAGGLDVNGNSLASAEIYDPASKTFTLTDGMTEARASQTSTLLP